MMSYADGTTVAVERSKAELDRLLSKHGATQRMIGSDDDAGFAFVVFRLAERHVRLRVPLPRIDDVEAPRRRLRVSPGEARAKAHEQLCRERWRAVVLLVKAKLELVALGLSTVEREFLADIFLPDGRTVHEFLREPLRQAYLGGTMPPLLGMGDGKAPR